MTGEGTAWLRLELEEKKGVETDDSGSGARLEQQSQEGRLYLER